VGKISDELRKKAHELGGYVETLVTAKELDDIADRIDREMVELPRDRDGEIIRIGDTIYDEWGHARTVRGTVLNDKGWVVIVSLCEDQKSRSITQWLHPTDFTHTRPDSWERIADELEAWCDGADVDGDACEKPRDLADRIRKLAEKEGE
jgi:hypothetical protein